MRCRGDVGSESSARRERLPRCH